MKTLFIYVGFMAAVFVAPFVALGEDFEDEGEIVEFHISAGTKFKAWNTPDTMVNVRVGQTLRIFNDDSIVHRLHTGDDRPCLHQDGSSAPGEFYDCVIINPADPDVDLMYDHNIGARARFYVRATP